MKKYNGSYQPEPVDIPDMDLSRGSIGKLKRDIDRGFRIFCEKRGIDPYQETFKITTNTPARVEEKEPSE